MIDVLKKAIEVYGENMQKVVAIEECSELIKEFCKRLRGQDNKLHIAEEIADVEIMLEQLKIIYNLNSEDKGTYKCYNLQNVITELNVIISLINEGACIGVSDVNRLKYYLEWIKEQFSIKELVEVYKDRKIERLSTNLELCLEGEE